jgi:hypothetical protein
MSPESRVQLPGSLSARAIRGGSVDETVCLKEDPYLCFERAFILVT